MLVVIPFFSLDSWLAEKNIKHWISMDGHVDYQCLLTYDGEADPKKVKELASQYFSKVVEHVYDPPPNRSWPYASNWAFQATAWFIINASKPTKGKVFIEPQPWLWVESDSVAMKPGWIKAIDECHAKGGKPFTGHWNHNTGVFNGVAVYPPNPNKYTHMMMLCDNNPWDVVASKYDAIEKNLNKANHLFQHIWTDPATDKPFTFSSMAEVRSVIRDTTVLFHRSKDGSIIDCLHSNAESKKSIETDSSANASTGSHLLVLPFCSKDYKSALLNLKLCGILDGKTNHSILLSYDDTTKPSMVEQVGDAARKCFRTVYHFCYESPKEKKWPKPQNHAFYRTCSYVEKHFTGAWFWWEQDAVPLKRGWYSELCVEYDRGDKPFGGHIVENMGHMNGTAFYPCDLKSYVNLGESEKAWDLAIRSKTIDKTHRMNRLIQNVWAFDKEGKHTLASGEVPSFKNEKTVFEFVDFGACIFHRCKDGTLQEFLIKKYSECLMDHPIQTC
jgi:hypothetical protein